MFNYYLRRSIIAISQRKKWFLVPILMTFVFIVGQYTVSPRNYIVKAVYTPPELTIRLNSDNGKILDENKLWNQALDEISIGYQFIADKARENSERMTAIMPYVVEALNNETSGETPNRRLRSYKREAIKYIISHLSMEQVLKGTALDSIEFRYEGPDIELGKKLVELYAGELLPDWKADLQKKQGRIQDRISSLDERLKNDQTPAIIQKKTEYELNLNEFKFMLSLLQNEVSPVQVEAMPRQFSDAIVARGFYCLIITMFLTLVLVIIIEFSGSTFTTEMQVSQYLNIRLIGTVSRLNIRSSPVLEE
ncbi:hypothetical protein KKA14_17520 [bacterium]|nr:hypothetical protein [bacterium]